MSVASKLTATGRQRKALLSRPMEPRMLIDTLRMVKETEKGMDLVLLAQLLLFRRAVDTYQMLHEPNLDTARTVRSAKRAVPVPFANDTKNMEHLSPIIAEGDELDSDKLIAVLMSSSNIVSDAMFVRLFSKLMDPDKIDDHLADAMLLMQRKVSQDVGPMLTARIQKRGLGLVLSSWRKKLRDTPNEPKLFVETLQHVKKRKDVYLAMANMHKLYVRSRGIHKSSLVPPSSLRQRGPEFSTSVRGLAHRGFGMVYDEVESLDPDDIVSFGANAARHVTDTQFAQLFSSLMASSTIQESAALAFLIVMKKVDEELFVIL